MINKGMSVRNYRALAGALAVALFLTACGDLGMVLPSQGSYRVNAQVDGDYTLDTYSVVTKNSRIRPYFVNSVVNDPDVRGLTVFVQDYSGAIVSRKVQYQLPAETKETQKPVEKPEPPPETPAPAAPAVEAGPKDIPEQASQEEPPEDGAVLPGETEKDPQTGDPESSEEAPPELPGEEPEEPAAEVPGELPPDIPEEAPADSFGENDDPRAETAAPAGVEAEDFGGTDTAYAADTAGDFRDTDTTGDSGVMDTDITDTAGTDVAGRDFIDTDTAGQDSTDNDAGNTDLVNNDTAVNDSKETDNADRYTTDKNDKNTDAVDTGIADTDIKNTDAADKDTATNAKDTDAIGTGPADTGVKNTDLADTDAAGKNAKDTDAADKDAYGTDAVGTAAGDAKTGDTDIADKGGNATGANTADTGGTVTAVPAPPPPPPPPPVEKAKPPIPADETVMVKQLDQYLPAFRIVEELDIGRYNLVFQVMGEKEILYRTYRPIYFIGDAKFTLGEIQSFLPVAITGGRLIPPGINVMLGTEISADPRLDPYIIWHNGKKIIAQGRLSEGANYLLWKTPEQTGFHSIRAEVFPLLPGDRMPGNMLGKIKELSLPVSSKSEGLRRFSDPSGEFINWYQLWGTLDDAKARNNSERRLVSLYAQAPRWTPFGGMYGLLVGPEDIYTLPGMPFKLSGDARGTGRIQLHFAALSEGSVLNIRFAGGEIPAQEDARGTVPAGTAALDLSFTGDALSLRIASGNLSKEESIELNGDEANSFITVSIEFAIAQDHFNAELRLENSAETTGLLAVALDTPISGEGSLRFGSSDYSRQRRVAKRPASGEAGKYNGTMVLNELALSYTRLPFPKKEEEPESGLPEILTTAEEDPGAEPEPPIPNAL
jgi:hypothetical protein